MILKVGHPKIISTQISENQVSDYRPAQLKILITIQISSESKIIFLHILHRSMHLKIVFPAKVKVDILITEFRELVIE
jgi:hypothetical protein